MVYLSSWSFIYFGSHISSEKARAVKLVQGGVRVLVLNQVKKHIWGLWARPVPGPVSPGCLPSYRCRPSGSGPPHGHICCSQKRKNTSLSFRKVLFWVEQGFSQCTRPCSIHSTVVTWQSRDPGQPVYWLMCSWRTDCSNVAM